jgi:hypothetical protein
LQTLESKEKIRFLFEWWFKFLHLFYLLARTNFLRNQLNLARALLQQPFELVLNKFFPVCDAYV